MARFDFEAEDDYEATSGSADGQLIGVGDAADGRIRARFAADGHLQNLDISPELLRHDRNGQPVMDSATFADEITRAINGAIDDLARTVAEKAAPGATEATAALNEIGVNFQQAISDARARLEQVERRLDTR